MSWLFSREYQISGKAEYKGRQILILGGVDAQEIPGGKPEVWLTLSSELLPHDLVMGGIPHAGSQHTSIESVMQSSHLILSHPLLLLPPIPPSIRIFSNESTLCMRWPKYWSFSFSIIPYKEIPGLISFRMDWLDLLAVQGTLKSVLQHHSSKASILQCSAFFTVQLSHPYMITGKIIALTRLTFVGKLMSLLFNMQKL